jgi:hypothetical protein
MLLIKFLKIRNGSSLDALLKSFQSLSCGGRIDTLLASLLFVSADGLQALFSADARLDYLMSRPQTKQ